MITSEKMIYKKIYRELYEIIDILTEEEKNKISQELISNIEKNMDKDYNFKIDKSRSVIEQELEPQTQALLIKLYEKYLCTDEEKEKWNMYDKLCYMKVENMRKKMAGNSEMPKRYNSIEEMRADEIKNKEMSSDADKNKDRALMEVKKESFWQKIIKKIKEKFINK